MGANGGEPYAFRGVEDALQEYIDSNPLPDEVPFVLAFLNGLLWNPRTQGEPVRENGELIGFFREVPKTQTFVTWAADHEKKDIVVYSIESLRSLFDNPNS